MKKNKRNYKKYYTLEERTMYHRNRINDSTISADERFRSRKRYNILLLRGQSTEQLKDELREITPRFSGWKEEAQYKNVLNELKRRKAKGIDFKSKTLISKLFSND